MTISNQAGHCNSSLETSQVVKSPPAYQKPKTTLFLEPRDIQGGSVNVPESNSGLLQS
ncbi:MAG: hypothetical protein ACD_45C00637G0002 [uncultured bacterium]|nr:MAG: hypothetical protein ACD_45C00637G0002 [uncultured bacterium]